MPGTDDGAAIDVAFAEGAAHVRAGVVEGVEVTIDIEENDSPSVRGDDGQAATDGNVAAARQRLLVLILRHG